MTSWARRCRTAALVAAVAALALVAVRLWPRPPLSAGVPQSVEVVDRNGRLLRLALASDQVLSRRSRRRRSRAHEQSMPERRTGVAD